MNTGQNNKSWEEEYRKNFWRGKGLDVSLDFIRTLLDEREAEVRKEEWTRYKQAIKDFKKEYAYYDKDLVKEIERMADEKLAQLSNKGDKDV